MTRTDIAILGTGAFAARILYDLAATSAAPLRVAIAGRNPERLAWLHAAANARAQIFGRPVEVFAETVDLNTPESATALVARLAPRVVVQAASPQASSVIGTTGDAWSRLVARTSLSVTAVFQAIFSVRVARAVLAARPDAFLVNCCYADVVNGMIRALGLPVACGVGNVAILAAVFAGELDPEQRPLLKVLAHYQTITPFRRPAAERQGPPPRVWIGSTEIGDVHRRFERVKLTAEPVIDVSGASGVPMLIAMATGATWRGHVPGPNGLPGGYPVALRDGVLDLDLPPGLSRAAAIAWNAGLEEANGLTVSGDGRVRYTGLHEERLREVSPRLAAGFDMRSLDDVHAEMVALRAKLQAQPA